MTAQNVTVRLMFGSTIQRSHGEHVERRISVSDADSILDVKEKISVQLQL